MKMILAVLAISCTASAMPEDRFKRDIENIRDSCVGRCFMQDKYREWFTQILPKAREFGKQLAEGGTQPAVPPVHPDKWEQYCIEIGTIRTCVGACSDAADAEKKTKADAILNAASNVVCDANIKVRFPCLQEVAKIPSPTCNI